MTQDQDLDMRLATPLPAVEDNGFTARTMARIETAATPFAWLETALAAAVAGLLLLVVPFSSVGDVMLRLSVEAANSLPLAAAVLAIALSLFWLNATAEE